MTIIQYIILASAIFLTGSYFRIKRHLNQISGLLSVDSNERNKLEIVMQPKWFLNSFWLIILLWIYSIYTFIAHKGWWSILFILGFYLLILIITHFLIVPSKIQILKFFYNTTSKRLKSAYKYNIEELSYLKKTNAYLVELLN